MRSQQYRNLIVFAIGQLDDEVYKQRYPILEGEGK